MKLFYRKAGEGPPLIILHGLFGSSDNWFSLSKVLARYFTVYAVDQRNHGQSPHSEEFSYALLTEDLGELLEAEGLKKARLIGHSMGGKTVMNFAVRYPSRVEKLVVVDIMPKAYNLRHDHIVEGLKAVPVQSLTSRAEAERYLMEHIPDADTRQFLMKNLMRTPEGRLAWKINLPSLDRHMEDIGGSMVYEGQFTGPVLFLMGARSNYYQPGDEQLVRQYFPHYTMTTLPTGHWVQAEDPEGFVRAVLPFLQA